VLPQTFGEPEVLGLEDGFQCRDGEHASLIARRIA